MVWPAPSPNTSVVDFPGTTGRTADSATQRDIAARADVAPITIRRHLQEAYAAIWQEARRILRERLAVDSSRPR